MSVVRYAIFTVNLAMSVSLAYGDEGMWLFTNPPQKWLKEHYDFEPQRCLAQNPCSSRRCDLIAAEAGRSYRPEGLVITNHHVGADALQKLSSTGPGNLLRRGLSRQNSR